MSRRRLLFATGNTHKVREIRDVLGNDYEIQSLADIDFHEEIPETRDTIEGNSLQKAEYLRDVLGRDGLAEDTGLEVIALDNAPGVLSARYAGEAKDADANMDLLLEKMSGLENRKARFKTVITLIQGKEVHQFEGILAGRIGTAKIGDHGFGYDPVFLLDDGRSLAQLDAGEKAAISHRAKAVRALVEFLAEK